MKGSDERPIPSSVTEAPGANPHPHGSTAWLVVEQRRLAADVDRIRDARDAEWQRRLMPLHEGFDGDGCESGDPIDWSVSALWQHRAADEDAVENAVAAFIDGHARRVAELAGENWEDLAQLQVERDTLRHLNAEHLVQRDDARTELDQARAERDRLAGLINTPHVGEFFEAVRIEAAHQRERWGYEHDAAKHTEDWIALFVYLLGKAATAYWAGNHAKLVHHVVTVAAVASNWHGHITGADHRAPVASEESAGG
jgi:hypothetical protein